MWRRPWLRACVTSVAPCTRVSGAGVVGLLRDGDRSTVLLRADKDALEVHEETGLPRASARTIGDGAAVPVMRGRWAPAGQGPPDRI